MNNFLIQSAKRALDNQIPKSLISASIELKIIHRKCLGLLKIGAKKEIQWLCVFDETATEDHIEFASIAGTEIIADFNNEYGINEMFEKINPNQKPRELKSLIYTRRNIKF